MTMLSTTHQFSSLASQVASVLRDEIDRNTWTEWLPGERSLTTSLQVSRKTLRKALAQLQGEGRIESVHGLGHRIATRQDDVGVSPSSEPIVALLSPDPLERMRPYTSLWVNQLKSMLMEKGVRLRTTDGHRYFTQQPARALDRLVSQQPATCWLLANSNEATQQWFNERGERCVIAGSCHSGIDLPHVDLDHYALCRHAAGVLLGAGHRRLALLNERSGRAGDVESEAGFVAGVRESRHDDATPLVVHHERSPVSLARVLDRILGMSKRPTALLVSNGASYLTVVSLLAQRRLRVPQDVSVVSRDDEPFLRSLVPCPAHYAANPQQYAKKLLKLLMQSLAGEMITPRSTRILPRYSRGESLAPPATAFSN